MSELLVYHPANQRDYEFVDERIEEPHVFKKDQLVGTYPERGQRCLCGKLEVKVKNEKARENIDEVMARTVPLDQADKVCENCREELR